MIDGLWTEGTLAEIIENVTQTGLSVFKMSTPVVLGDQECSGLTCPVDQRKKLFRKKGTRSRSSRWVQTSKNIRHAPGMCVIIVGKYGKLWVFVEDSSHSIQEFGCAEHVIVLTSA